VQVLEDSHAYAGISWDVCQAHLLAGADAVTGLDHLFGKANLTSAEEQHPPLRDRARSAVASGPAFALAVRQHIGDPAGLAPVDLAHLVQAQERIAVCLGGALKPICGRPPLTQIAVNPTSAPDAARDAQRCRLA